MLLFGALSRVGRADIYVIGVYQPKIVAQAGNIMVTKQFFALVSIGEPDGIAIITCKKP